MYPHHLMVYQKCGSDTMQIFDACADAYMYKMDRPIESSERCGGWREIGKFGIVNFMRMAIKRKCNALWEYLERETSIDGIGK